MKKHNKVIVIFGLFLIFLILIFEAQLIFNFPLGLLIFITFLFGLLFSFLLIPHRNGFKGIDPKDWLYVVVFGFIVAEMVFLLSFWPFNCITTSVVLLTIYYVMWDVWSFEKKNRLTLNKIIFNLILIVVALSVLLSTTKWLP